MEAGNTVEQVRFREVRGRGGDEVETALEKSEKVL